MHAEYVLLLLAGLAHAVPQVPQYPSQPGGGNSNSASLYPTQPSGNNSGPVAGPTSPAKTSTKSQNSVATPGVGGAGGPGNQGPHTSTKSKSKSKSGMASPTAGAQVPGGHGPYTNNDRPRPQNGTAGHHPQKGHMMDHDADWVEGKCFPQVGITGRAKVNMCGMPEAYIKQFGALDYPDCPCRVQERCSRPEDKCFFNKKHRECRCCGRDTSGQNSCMVEDDADKNANNNCNDKSSKHHGGGKGEPDISGSSTHKKNQHPKTTPALGQGGNGGNGGGAPASSKGSGKAPPTTTPHPANPSGPASASHSSAPGNSGVVTADGPQPYATPSASGAAGGAPPAGQPVAYSPM